MSRRNYNHSMDSFLNASGTTLTASEPKIEPATQPVVSPKPTTTLSGTTIVSKPPRLSTNLSGTTTSPTLLAPAEQTKEILNATPVTTTVASTTPVYTTPVIVPVYTAPIISDVISVPTPTTTNSSPTFGGGGGGGSSKAPESTNNKSAEAVGGGSSFLKRNWIPLILVASAVYVFVKKPLNK